MRLTLQLLQVRLLGCRLLSCCQLALLSSCVSRSAGPLVRAGPTPEESRGAASWLLHKPRSGSGVGPSELAKLDNQTPQMRITSNAG